MTSQEGNRTFELKEISWTIIFVNIYHSVVGISVISSGGMKGICVPVSTFLMSVPCAQMFIYEFFTTQQFIIT